MVVVHLAVVHNDALALVGGVARYIHALILIFNALELEPWADEVSKLPLLLLAEGIAFVEIDLIVIVAAVHGQALTREFVLELSITVLLPGIGGSEAVHELDGGADGSEADSGL